MKNDLYTLAVESTAGKHHVFVTRKNYIRKEYAPSFASIGRINRIMTKYSKTSLASLVVRNEQVIHSTAIYF